MKFLALLFTVLATSAFGQQVPQSWDIPSVLVKQLIDMHPMPAIAVTIPTGIISAPNGTQTITQPGTSFLIVNRLQVTSLLDYTGIISGSISGNAATATQLQTAPTQCPGGYFAVGIQQTGNANCSNTFPTTGVSFSTLYVTGAPLPYTSQGAYINWNLTVGGGETDFVNNRGGGAGGFHWYNALSNGTVGAPIMTLDQSGVLTPAGGLLGNAATATQFAGSPTQCPVGSVLTGIQQNGNANCTSFGASTQYASTTSVCTTGGSSYDTCPSSVTWPAAFASNSYTAACMGIGPSDGRAMIQGITNQTTSGVTFNVVTEGSVPVTFSKVVCIGTL
jgi:hypothetical protein